MNLKQKEQLLQFETLRLNIHRMTYEQCVDVLIEKYLGLADALEYDESERFKKELKRIQQPTN